MVFPFILHSDFLTSCILSNPHKSNIMLLCTANFAIAANFATVAFAISAYPTESTAEKSTDDAVATIPIRTKHFESLLTHVVKREARCLN